MIDDEADNWTPDHDDVTHQQGGSAQLPARVVQDNVQATSFTITRHDPFFVTQLIATAVQVPQTRTLRRASPEDAQMSYRSATDKNKPQPVSRATGTSRVV